MRWKPASVFGSKQKVANLVGMVLVGSVVEAHEPNEISRNRFRLRCDCGALFHSVTPVIQSRHRHRAKLACLACTPAAPEKKATASRRETAARCEHGFADPHELCPECRGDIRRTA